MVVKVTVDTTEFRAAIKRIEKPRMGLGMWRVEAEKARRAFEEQWEKLEATLRIGEKP